METRKILNALSLKTKKKVFGIGATIAATFLVLAVCIFCFANLLPQEVTVDDSVAKLLNAPQTNVDSPQYEWKIKEKGSQDSYVKLPYTGSPDQLVVSSTTVSKYLDADNTTQIECAVHDQDGNLAATKAYRVFYNGKGQTTIADDLADEIGNDPIKSGELLSSEDSTPAALPDANANHQITVNYMIEGEVEPLTPTVRAFEEGQSIYWEIALRTTYGAPISKESSDAEQVNFDFNKDYTQLVIISKDDQGFMGITHDINITITYSEQQGKYRIKVYKQNTDDDNYTVDEVLSETKIAPAQTAIPTQEDMRELDGFVILSNEFETVAITSVSEVSIFYNRLYFLSVFSWNGGINGPESFLERYEKKFPVVNQPSKDGYWFNGWTDQSGTPVDLPSTVPCQDIVYQASWVPAKEVAKVKIVYWGENADDTDFSYLSSFDIDANVNTQFELPEDWARPEEYEYEYYGTRDIQAPEDTPVWDHPWITPDDKTVCNVKLKRKRFTYHFNDLYDWSTWYGDITAKWGAYIYDQYLPICRAAWGDEYPDIESAPWKINDHSNNYIDLLIYMAKPTWQENEHMYFKDSYHPPSTDDGFFRYYLQKLGGMFENHPSAYGWEREAAEDNFDALTVGIRGGFVTSEEDYINITGFTTPEPDSGWGNADAPGLQVDPERYGDLNFYYKRNTYDVILNNEKEGPIRIEVQYQDSINDKIVQEYSCPLWQYVPERPSYVDQNYVFSGWYLNPECTGDPFVISNPEEFPEDVKHMNASELSLYAKWDACYLPVKFFDYNGNLIREDSRLYKSIYTGYYPAPDPVMPPGSKFICWVYYTEDQGGRVEHPFDPYSMPVLQGMELYPKYRNDNFANYTVYYKTENPDTHEMIDIASPKEGKAIINQEVTFYAKGGDQLAAAYKDYLFPDQASKTMVISEDVSQNVITFYYDIGTANYQVRYLTATPEGDIEIAQTKTVTDYKRTTATETFIPIANYTPIPPYQQTVILPKYTPGAEPYDIRFYYEYHEEPIPTATVAVHYDKIRHNGEEEIIEEETDVEEVDVNTHYQAIIKTFQGYSYDPSDPRNVTEGDVTQDGLELRVIYKADLYEYTLHYWDVDHQGEGDQPIREDVTGTAEMGTIIYITDDIFGYHPVDTEQYLQVLDNVEGNEVRFLYKENDSVTVTYTRDWYDYQPSDPGKLLVNGQEAGEYPVSELVPPISGTPSTLKAVANDGYRFDHWYNDLDESFYSNDPTLVHQKVSVEGQEYFIEAHYHAVFVSNISFKYISYEPDVGYVDPAEETFDPAVSSAPNGSTAYVNDEHAIDYVFDYWSLEGSVVPITEGVIGGYIQPQPGEDGAYHDAVYVAHFKPKAVLKYTIQDARFGNLSLNNSLFNQSNEAYSVDEYIDPSADNAYGCNIYQEYPQSLLYTFDAWYKVDQFGNPQRIDGSIMESFVPEKPSEGEWVDTRYIAKFNINTAAITYNVNYPNVADLYKNGSEAPTEFGSFVENVPLEDYSANGAYVRLKEGVTDYEFSGWFRNEETDPISMDESFVPTVSSPEEWQTVTYTAKYTNTKRIHMTYKLERPEHGLLSFIDESATSDTELMEDFSVDGGKPIGCKVINTKDDVYTFDAWYQIIEGVEIKMLDSSKDGFIPPKPTSGEWKDATYVAKFVTQQATLTYNIASSDYGKLQPVGGEPITDITYQEKIDKDCMEQSVGCTVFMNSMQTTLYTLKGWYYADSPGSDPVWNELEFHPEKQGEYWSDQSFTVDFEIETVTITYTNPYPDAGGIAYWEEFSSGTTELVQEIPKNATIDSLKGVWVEQNDEQKAVYEIEGWYIQGTDIKVGVGGSYKPTMPDPVWADATYEVRFKAKPANITYQITEEDGQTIAHYGVLHGLQTEHAQIGKTITEEIDPFQDTAVGCVIENYNEQAYEFVGWFREGWDSPESFGLYDRFTPTNFGTPWYGEIKYFAKFRQKDCEIEYKYEPTDRPVARFQPLWEGSEDREYVKSLDTHAKGLILNCNYPDDYIFDGWYVEGTDQKVSTAIGDDNAFTPGPPSGSWFWPEKTVFVAKFIAKKVTITYRIDSPYEDDLVQIYDASKVPGHAFDERIYKDSQQGPLGAMILEGEKTIAGYTEFKGWFDIRQDPDVDEPLSYDKTFRPNVGDDGFYQNAIYVAVYRSVQSTFIYKINPEDESVATLQSNDPAKRDPAPILLEMVDVNATQAVGVHVASVSDQYRFDGWYDSDSGEFLGTNPVLRPHREPSEEMWYDHNFEARFSRNATELTYTVQDAYFGNVRPLDSQETMYEYKEQVSYGKPAIGVEIVPNEGILDHYDFVGWYDDLLLVTTDTKLIPVEPEGSHWEPKIYWAKFEPKKTKITYEVQNDIQGTLKQGDYTAATIIEEIPMNQKQAKGVTAIPNGDRYSFDKWYCGSEVISEGTPTLVPDKGDAEFWPSEVTYTATFVSGKSQIEYTIEGFGERGRISPVDKSDVKVLDYLETIDADTEKATGVSIVDYQEGTKAFEFLGWFMNDSKVPVEGSTDISAAFTPERPGVSWPARTKFTAKFKERTINIHYEVKDNDGQYKGKLSPHNEGSDIKFDTTVLAFSQSPASCTAIVNAGSGYMFDGWYKKVGDTEERIEGAGETLYPQKGESDFWEETTFVVHFVEEADVKLAFDIVDYDGVTPGLISFEEEGEYKDHLEQTLSPSTGVAKNVWYKVNPGFEFAYWTKTVEGGQETPITSDNPLVPPKDGKVYSNASYKAYFKAKSQVKITYESNDYNMGTVDPNFEDVYPYQGQDAINGCTATPNPGYSIDQWYVKNGENWEPISGTEGVDKYVPQKPATGEWAAASYKVQFKSDEKVKLEYISEDENKGSVDPASEMVEPAGVATGSIATPAKGYRFDKWVDEQGKEVCNTAQFVPEKDPVSQVYSAKIYTAKFVEESMVVINYAVDSSVHGKLSSYRETLNPVSSPKAEGSTATANAGYIFDCWKDESGSKIEDPSWVSGTTLTPQKIDGAFEAHTYTAYFKEKADVKLSYALASGQTGYGTLTVKTSPEQKGLTTWEETISPIAASATNVEAVPGPGYVFDDWGIVIDGGEEQMLHTAALLVPEKQGEEFVNATYYAHFKKHDDIDIYYQAGLGGTVSSGSEKVSPIPDPENPPKGSTALANPGYHFVSWTNGKGQVVGKEANFVPKPDMTLGIYLTDTYTANFESDPAVTINYVSSDITLGTVNPTSEQVLPWKDFAAGSTARCIKAGYHFVGWYHTVGGQEELVTTSNIITPAKDPDAGVIKADTYTAKFEQDEAEYFVYYALEGGTTSLLYEHVPAEGEEPQGSEAIAEPGYIFDYWTKNDDATPVSWDQKLVPEKEGDKYVGAIFYAHFKQQKSAHITYSVNPVGSGDLSLSEETVEAAKGTPVGSEVTAHSGYHFKHWARANDLDTPVSYSVKFVPEKDPDFKYFVDEDYVAVIEENTAVHIDYKSTVGGYVTVTSEDINPVTGVPSGSQAIANYGYHFLGWYDADGKFLTEEKQFTPSRSSVTGLYESGSYCAHFEENEPVSLAYQVADDQEHMGYVTNTAETVKPVSGDPQGSTAIANTGYHFVKWTVTVPSQKIQDKEVSRDAALKPEKLPVIEAFADSQYKAYFEEDETIEITYTVNGPSGCGSLTRNHETLSPVSGKAEGSRAKTNPGYEFINWTYMDGDKEVVVSNTDTFVPEKESGIYVEREYFANYKEQDEITINYYVYDENQGTVSPGSEQIKPLSTEEPQGATATAKPGFHLVSWTMYIQGTLEGIQVAGAVSHYVPQKINNLYRPATYVPNFEEDEDALFTYEVASTCADKGYVDNAQEFVAPVTGTPEGSTAHPNAGSKFVKWIDEVGQTVSTDPKLVPSRAESGLYESAKYRAVFEEQDEVTLVYQVKNNYSVDAGKVKLVDSEDEAFSVEEKVKPVTGVPKGAVAVPFAGFHVAYWAEQNFGGEIVVSTEETFVPVKQTGESWTKKTYFVYFEEDDPVTLTYNVSAEPDKAHGEVEPPSEVVDPVTGSANGVDAYPEAGYHLQYWKDEAGNIVWDASTATGKFVPLKSSIGGKEGQAYIKQTYTAEFAVNPDVTISYVANGEGGTCEPPSETLSPVADHAVGSSATPDSGFQLAYWTNAAGEIVGYDTLFVPTKPEGGAFTDATYYANFKPATQNIIRYFAVADDGRDNCKVSRASEIVTSEMPEAQGSSAQVYPGYQFINWTYIDAGGQAVEVSTEKTWKPTNVTGWTDIVYYANFKEQDAVEFSYVPVDHPHPANIFEEIFNFAFANDPAIGGSVDPVKETVKPVNGLATGSLATENTGFDFGSWTDAEEQPVPAEWVVEQRLTPQKTHFAAGTGGYDLEGEAYVGATYHANFIEQANVTFTYEADEGGIVTPDTESVAPVTGTASGSTAVPDDGYTFDNWTNSAGRIVSYDAKYVPSKIAGIYKEDTFTAHFVETKVRLSYVSDDPTMGTVEPSSELVPVEGEAVGCDAKAQPGYKFVKWVDSKETQVSESAHLDPPKTEGKYVEDTYKAYFAPIESVTINYEVSPTYAATLKNPSSESLSPTSTVPPQGNSAVAVDGFSFVKWIDKKTEQEVWAFPDNFVPSKTSEGVYANATYVAVFEANEITISYESDDEDHGSVDPASETLKVDAEAASGSTATAADGWHLYCWKNKATGAIVGYGEEFIPTKERYSQLFVEATYVACFVEDENVHITYGVYEGKGGSVLPEEDVFNPTTGAPEGSTPTASTGYVFEKWVDADGKDVPAEWVEADTHHLTPQKIGDEWTDASYFAKFSENTVTIKYQSNDEKMGKVDFPQETIGVDTGSPTGSEAIAEPGFHFVKWVNSEGLEVSDIEKYVPAKGPDGIYVEETYTAHFEEDPAVEITYRADIGGSVSPEKETVNPASGTANGSDAAANPGYEFVNWTTESGTEVTKDTHIDPPKKDIYSKVTYVAHFKELEVVINYQSSSPDAGSVSVSTETVLDVTGTAKGSAAKAYKGYHFVEWIDSNKEVVSSEAIFTPQKKDGVYVAETYTAVFVEDSATFKYAANPSVGGSVSLEEETIEAKSAEGPTGSIATAKPGYNFLHWTDSFGKVVCEDAYFKPSPVEGIYYSADYTAVFEKQGDVTITYYVENGSAGEKRGEVTTKSETFSPATSGPAGSSALVYPGYTFVNWTNEAGDVVSTKQNFVPEKPSGGQWTNAKYCANFKENDAVTINYSVNSNHNSASAGFDIVKLFTQLFNAGGGSVSPGTETLAPATGNATGSTAVADEGYHFVNWTNSAGEVVSTDITFVPEKVKQESADGLEGYIYVASQFNANFAKDDDAHIVYYANTGGSVNPEEEFIDPVAQKALGSTATADNGYEFVSWTDKNGKVVSEDEYLNPPKPVDKYVDAEYWANFKEKIVTVEYMSVDMAKGSVDRTIEKCLAVTGMSLRGSTATPASGYRFAYWMDETGKQVSTLNKFVPSKVDGKYYESATYTAVFESESKAIISYYATRGGTVDPKREFISRDATESIGSTATADPGYEFVEWQDAQGNKVSDDPTFRPLPEKTGGYITTYYRAIFKEQSEITIHYEADNPAEGLHYGEVSVDEESLLPVSGIAGGSRANAYPGYHFVNWTHKDESGKDVEVSTDQDFVPQKVDGAYVEDTYTAHYAENDPVTIKYITNKGGSTSVAFEIIKPVSGQSLGSTANPATGFHFDQWKNADGQTLTTDPLFVAPKTELTQDGLTGYAYVEATYYAVFAENEIVINYESSDYTKGSVKPSSETIKAVTGRPEGSVASAAVGSNFVQWINKATGEIVGKNEKFVPQKLAGVYETATYVAVFQGEEEVTINYAAGDHGSVDPTSETLSPTTGEAKGSTATPDKGYHLLNWTDSKGTEVSKDKTFVPQKTGGVYVAETYTAHFEEDQVTLTYTAREGGKVNRTSETIGAVTGEAKGSVADASPGYSFVNWTDHTGKIVSTEETFVPEKQGGIYLEETYTANFIEGSKVAFFYFADNGLEGELRGEVEINFEMFDPAVATPKGSTAKTYPGYEFVNWTNANGDEVGTDIHFTPEKGTGGQYETAYYVANYKELPDTTQSYEASTDEDFVAKIVDVLTFNWANLGQNEEGGSVAPTSESVAPGSGKAQGSLATANKGYHFVNWTNGSGDEVGTDPLYVPQRVKQTSSEAEGKLTSYIYVDGQYTAHFAKNEMVTITYEASVGGSTDPTSETLDPEAEEAHGSTATADPGYKFVCWKLGDQFVSDQETFVPQKQGGVFVSATYTAYFEEEVATFNYVTEDIEKGHVSRTVESVGAATGEPLGSTATAETDYQFLAWYVDGQQVSTLAKLIPEKVDGRYVSATYTAKFARAQDVRINYLANQGGVVDPRREVFDRESTPDGSDAIAKKGYKFVEWRDADGRFVTDNPHIYPEEPTWWANDFITTYYKAYFEELDVTINYVAENPTGEMRGEVSSSTETVLAVSGEPKGSTALCYPGYHFAYWAYINEEGEEVEVSRDKTFVPQKVDGAFDGFTYIAHYEQDEDVTITYSSADTLMGDVSVASETASPAFGNDAKGSEALANDNYHFIYWKNSKGDVVPSTKDLVPARSKVVSEDGLEGYVYAELAYTAYFAEDANTATFTYTSKGGGVVSPTSEVVFVDEVMAQGSTAMAQPGYKFVNWTNSDGDVVSEEPKFAPSRTVEGDPFVDAEYFANFEELEDVILTYNAAFGGTVTKSSESLPPATGEAEGSVATPDGGYFFVNWTDASGAEVSQEPSYVPQKVDVTTEEGVHGYVYKEATYTAHFVDHPVRPSDPGYWEWLAAQTFDPSSWMLFILFLVGGASFVALIFGLKTKLRRSKN